MLDVKVINKEPMPGNKIAPELKIEQVVSLKQIYRCKCGEHHYDVGLISELEFVRCYKCKEVLPESDRVHWCHSSRFVTA